MIRMIIKMEDVAKELDLSNQLERMLLSPTIYMVVNQISDNVNTIELAAEILRGDLGLVTFKAEKILEWNNSRDLKIPRHQLVLFEELNQMAKLLKRCGELDALVSHGSFKNTKRIMKIQKGVADIKEVLKLEARDFDHTICTRAIVKYGRKHTNMPTKLSNIVMDVVKLGKELGEVIDNVKEIMEECQKPNGSLRWYTRKAWLKVRADVWVGRNRRGDVITEIEWDGRRLKRVGFDTNWTQILEKDKKESYFGGIAILNTEK